MNRFRIKIARTTSPIFLILVLLFALPINASAQRRESQTNNLLKFYSIASIVQQYYVDDVSSQINSIVNESLKNILSNLDQHSRLYSAQEYSDMTERYLGDYEGIGASYYIVNSAFVILETIPGGPSETAGLKPGDIITHIDGVTAFPATEEGVKNRVRGKQGTNVTLSAHSLDGSLQDITITRKKVDIRAVSLAIMLDAETGYIRLTTFSAKTRMQVADAIRDLKSQGMKRLVFDLRNNGGGLKSQATALADLFLDQGQLIWKTQSRNPQAISEGISLQPPLLSSTAPMIVLVNGNSASASELVSGALQDWDRALIIGSETFGKALVQSQYPMRDGGALFLTIARYTTPTGRSIQIERDHDGNVLDSIAPPQAFQTLLTGRTVLSRGGITPDIETKPLLISGLSVYLQNWSDSEKRYYMTYEFGLMWARNNPTLLQLSIEDYITNVDVDDVMLNAFARFVLAHPGNPGAWATNPTTPQELRIDPIWQKNVEEDMKILLKAAVIKAIWGERGASTYLLSIDPEIAEALAQFPNAVPPITYQHQ